jgi:hypothetical protein
VKVTRTIATGVFLGWMCQSSAAVPPAVERPTPPPCCADGQCFASPLTYGYYDTRWRRWPMESLAQASTGKAAGLPSTLRQEFAPFTTPPPEQEDRKAPPPSVPVGGEQTPTTGAVPRTPGGPAAPIPPQGFPPPGGPAPPGAQPRGATGFPSQGLPAPAPQTAPMTPQTAPITPPTGPGAQPAGQPMFKNVSPDSPLNRPGPMGDADPPPALPFGPALVAPEQPSRDVSQQPSPAPVRTPSLKRVPAPSSDPPPALPIALASYEE